MSKFAIKVIWLDGTEEYLKTGHSGRVADFRSRDLAEAQRDFMLAGMAEEAQSINIVPYPTETSA